MLFARLGIWISEKAANRRHACGWNDFSGYVVEILQHRGVPYEVLTREEMEGAELLARYDVIVVAGPAEAEEEERLYHYAHQGGWVISLAGMNSQAERLGCSPATRSVLAYAEWTNAELDIGLEACRLRYAEALPWAVIDPGYVAGAFGNVPGSVFGNSGGNSQGNSDNSLILRLRAGSGRVDRLAVHVPDTVVKLQQGDRPVVEDGSPAPDGTAAVNDGVLKADDVMLLDWEADRSFTATGVPYFALPHADGWRELFIGYLVRSAWERKLALPFVGYWPNGVEQVAHLSHDSDFNEDAHAWTTLDLLQEQGIRSTWCMLEPGYSKPVYERVAQEGHELAFHYNAVAADGGVWGEAAFRRQLLELKRLSGHEDIVTNKNHLTRVEGWGELFRWCEQTGIASDQTRGPSKLGNLGFLFGTCHPYFPAAWADERNRRYDVLEVGFLTPDMNAERWGDDSLIEPLLARVAHYGGVAHFLFHQIHLHTKEGARQAFRRMAEAAAEQQFTWMTNREINAWERSKRTLAVAGLRENGNPIVLQQGTFSHAHVADAFVVWVPMAQEEAQGKVQDKAQGGAALHYGVPCRSTVMRV